jgi:hypothetical protein
MRSGEWIEAKAEINELVREARERVNSLASVSLPLSAYLATHQAKRKG